MMGNSSAFCLVHQEMSGMQNFVHVYVTDVWDLCNIFLRWYWIDSFIFFTSETFPQRATLLGSSRSTKRERPGERCSTQRHLGESRHSVILTPHKPTLNRSFHSQVYSWGIYTNFLCLFETQIGSGRQLSLTSHLKQYCVSKHQLF